ncbi:DUF2147 domain-containing protein [Zhouia sp. PK063]|uniref:DUF2147 domain-containing protein n=1 Tax=Zhouia sp. PK063 TaxID=3373602 RepID=UPI0037AA3105
MKNKFAIVIVMLFSITSLFAQENVLGKWKTIDDDTGQAKSIVEIYQEDGVVKGKVVEILNKDRQDRVCENCKGDKKNKPILGMVIIENMKKDGNEYTGGTILDPEKGKEYRCKLWLDENDKNKLNVRGYVAFLYRTQNWYRVD